MASLQGAWARVLLQLCLLGVLESEGPSYGHALPSRLPAAGLDTVKPATLHPALARLAEEGTVEIRWAAGESGPGRKYYSITEQGRAPWRAAPGVGELQDHSDGAGRGGKK